MSRDWHDERVGFYRWCWRVVGSRQSLNSLCEAVVAAELAACVREAGR